jgi:hypothetical protein
MMWKPYLRFERAGWKREKPAAPDLHGPGGLQNILL